MIVQDLSLNLLPQSISKLCMQIEPVGSRVTCQPAPTDTDNDMLVLVEKSNWETFYSLLQEEGFDDGGGSGEFVFASFVKDEINVIATYDAMFFKKFMAATSIAKRLNLLHKNDRIALFQAVLYGNACE